MVFQFLAVGRHPPFFKKETIMKHAFRLLAAAGLTTVAFGPVLARENPKPAADSDQKAVQPDAKEAQKPTPQVRAFVGVFVGPVHPALAAQLSDLNRGQGVVVEAVADDSPASKAGLKVHDILTNYDDQKLFSPEQFAGLVQSDKPDRETTIQFLRDGKSQRTQITLSQQEMPQGRHWRDHEPVPFHRGRHHTRRHSNESRGIESEWSSFDSLTLKKLDQDKFRAEIQYLDKDQKMEKHTFEGTRDEIHHDIMNEKDLTPREREHLLRSLNLDPDAGFFNPWLGSGLGWHVAPPAQFR